MRRILLTSPVRANTINGMSEHETIRMLLAEQFPGVDAKLQPSNTRNVMLMWPIDSQRLFNFMVDRKTLLEALQSGVKTERELFERARIPKWHVEYFLELRLKFS